MHVPGYRPRPSRSYERTRREKLLEKARDGDPAAIEAVLAASTPSREVIDALQEALALKPVTVLRAVKRSRHRQLVCGKSVQETYDLAQSSYDERQSAVGSAIGNNMGNANDQARLKACANSLDRAEAREKSNVR